MKGFYKIIFKTGMVFYIAITKVRYSPKAYFVDAEVNLTTGDITFSYIESKNLPMNNFTVPASKTQTVNIKDFFYSKWFDYGFATELKLDLSYREKYAQQLADADK